MASFAEKLFGKVETNSTATVTAVALNEPVAVEAAAVATSSSPKKETASGEGEGEGKGKGKNNERIFLAADAGDVLEIKTALESLKSESQGCNIDLSAILDKDGCSLLHRAAANGRISVIKYLVKQGLDVNTVDVLGGTALLEAASAGHLNVVKWLVGHGLSPNSPDNRGENALHVAAAQGQSAVVEWIVKNCNANLNSMTKTGGSALTCAVTYNRLEVVKILVKHGADIYARERGHGWNLLHVAAANNRFQEMAFLIEYDEEHGDGSLLESMTMEGLTAGQLAVREKFPACKQTYDFFVKKALMRRQEKKAEEDATTAAQELILEELERERRKKRNQRKRLQKKRKQEREKALKVKSADSTSTEVATEVDRQETAAAAMVLQENSKQQQKVLPTSLEDDVWATSGTVEEKVHEGDAFPVLSHTTMDRDNGTVNNENEWQNVTQKQKQRKKVHSKQGHSSRQRQRSGKKGADQKKSKAKQKGKNAEAGSEGTERIGRFRRQKLPSPRKKTENSSTTMRAQTLSTDESDELNESRSSSSPSPPGSPRESASPTREDDPKSNPATNATASSSSNVSRGRRSVPSTPPRKRLSLEKEEDANLNPRAPSWSPGKRTWTAGSLGAAAHYHSLQEAQRAALLANMPDPLASPGAVEAELSRMFARYVHVDASSKRSARRRFAERSMKEHSRGVRETQTNLGNRKAKVVNYTITGEELDEEINRQTKRKIAKRKSKAKSRFVGKEAANAPRKTKGEIYWEKNVKKNKRAETVSSSQPTGSEEAKKQQVQPTVKKTIQTAIDDHTAAVVEENN